MPSDRSRQRPWPLSMLTLPGDMDADFDVGSDVATVPNLVTLLRLFCVPVFLWLLFGAEHRFAAALLLAVLGATDWVDGWLARALDQHSSFGKAFDPVVDRIMFVVAMLAMLYDGSVPIVFGVAVLVREVLVSAMALGLASIGAERLEVSWWGKASTFGLMFAFPLFLAGSSDVGSATVWNALAWGTGLPSLVASWWAAALYVRPALMAARQRANSSSRG